jgi:EAL domain-containing protein (putative c-di-GMP-specific phosphodiesterase class I)
MRKGIGDYFSTLSERFGEGWNRFWFLPSDALDTSQFVLYAQSIVPIQNTSWPSHYEVLVRMRDGDSKLIGPMGFIPAAERYGLMRALDRWVIQNALSEMAQHADLSNGSCYGINLSGSSMDDEGLLDFIREQFDRYGLPASLVCFEITETIAISNLRGAVRMIHELKDLGCKFALDDFGSGMSSFAYLRQLPVDFVKIDGNFVRDIATDQVNHAMVESINKVGHVMGIGTIAEFVEDAETMAILKAVGVDYAQGFGISKPDRLFGHSIRAAEAQLVH